MFSRRLRGVLSIAFALGTMPLLVPGALAANGLTLTTPYPAITVSPGTQVSFDLSLKTTNPARIDLAVSGTPASWKATLHGGGYVVGAVQTNGTDATVVRLDVDVPEAATGSTKLTVTATSAGETASLALDIKVQADAGGEITVKPDYTALRGSSNQSFTFNLTITNGTPEDVSYTATGEGPDGWTVDVTLTGQAQAVSGTAKAGSNANAAVKVTPSTTADAGTYKVAVVATVAGQAFPIELDIEITGSYALVLSTPNQALSGSGSSGSATQQQFTITNNGTAPVTNVVMSATPPTNWDVTFTPATTDTIEAGASVTVTANITPSGAAIAGDYSITFNARAKEANDSVDFRFTVETSLVGALIGGLVIVLAIGGLFWVFRRYGRR